MEFFAKVAQIFLTYYPLFFSGMKNTLILAIVGTVAGLLIGLLVGIYKTINIKPTDFLLKRILYKVFDFFLSAYIEVFRSTPMMVQAMLVFYGVAAVFEIRLNPFIAGLIIIAINTGAYMSEIVRGGIISVDNGQYEAAHSIGMTHWQAMSGIILPQALRNIMPAVGNEFIINIKDSCVLSVITVTELFFQTRTVAGKTFATFESYAIVCVFYFVLAFTLTQILRYIERRMDGPDTYRIHGSQSVPEVELDIQKVRGRE